MKLCNICLLCIFVQLYNLSGEAERKEFLDKLFDYMQKKGQLSETVK